MTRKIALVLEYEGTEYAGFQRQANASSVQAALEQAVLSLTGAPVRVKAAGRTDAGVHSAGQVVAFETQSSLPPESFRRGLNHYLPGDISVAAAYETPLSFDPRRHAVARVYRYTILTRGSRSALRRRSVHLEKRPLDEEAMAQAMGSLEGERDFAPFTGALEAGKSTVRRLYRTRVWNEGDEIHLELEGNAFLPQQVRRMVGAALQVGLGKLTLAEFVLLADTGRRGAAHWVLPPAGLCLQEVKYREFPPENHARTTDDPTYAAVPIDTAVARP